MRSFGWLAIVSLTLTGAGSSLAGEPTGVPITLQLAKYSDLEKTIRGFKGKVVLVDFWAEY